VAALVTAFSLVVVPVQPARAATPAVSGLTGAVSGHGVLLTWTAGGDAPAAARDVTGVATSPLTPADGRPLPVVGLTATDLTGFDNSSSHTYAVWGMASDGTASDSPALVTVNPAVIPTYLTLAASYATAPWGTKVLTLSGHLTATALPLSGHVVDLWGATVGTPMVLLRHLTTTSSGGFATTLMPARSTAYQVRFAGDSFHHDVASPAVVVRVTARISAAFLPNTVLRGQVATIRGQLLPRIPGVVLVIQRHLSTGWQSYRLVRTATDGTYRLPLTLPVGQFGFRVVLPARTGLATAVSPQAVLRVEPRNLVDGMTGSDVLGLQQRLTRLHYDTGALNGRYGYDLHHAVMTFQKVERLPVTGYWGNAERLRATHPTAWTVRYPSSGRAVEIDITRQVLVLSQAGAVVRIVDVSTGSGKVYYLDGVRNIAHTPRGHFSVFYKINGIRISKLGELYKPSYFFQGYAVHGSASVPNYPASHGCVRITDPNADRLFPLLTYHTPVTVFDE
jgi:hypothetical protein